MTAEILASINTFVDAMVDSKAMFEAVRAEISEKDSAVTKCISAFQDGVARLLSRKFDTEDEDIKTLYENMRKSLQDLLDAVADDIKRTQKGTEFIRKYEQSFNVAVFGKVKAGKSYLGNFVMGNNIRDMGIATSYDKLPRPKVEVHDKGNVSVQERMAEITEEGQDGFGVAANEATSAIQLFRLGGLTWFDTPGIGSVNWDNELLAKEYVDNADLVIFACNSDAAGTRQDFAEMRMLHEKGKPFLLLLTQSDTVEEDYDEETEDVVSVYVPKSEKDRADTEQYMLGELQGSGIRLNRDEILTISAKLAMVALENDDPALFQNSHMDKFLEILTNITKTDGAKLKSKTPNDRINATIGDIEKRLMEASKKIKGSQKELKEKQERLSTHGDLLLVEMQQDCLNRVDTLIRQKVAEVEKTGEAISADEIGKLLSNEVLRVLIQTCADEFSSSVDVLSGYEVNMGKMSDLKQKKDVIKYEVHTVKWVERDPDGIIEHIGSFFGKSYYTARNGTEERTQEIDLGVNEQQVISIAHGQLDKLFHDEVPGLMKKISARYLEQVSKLLEESANEIQTAWQTLENLKCKH